MVLVLRAVAKVPDPSPQGPPADALIVTVEFWRCEWFEESTWKQVHCWVRVRVRHAVRQLVKFKLRLTHRVHLPGYRLRSDPSGRQGGFSNKLQGGTISNT